MLSSKTTRVLGTALAWAALLSAPVVFAAGAQALPARDLTVELRQIEEPRAQAAEVIGSAVAAGKSFSAGGASSTAWEPQMVQVRNGEKASLSLQSTTPMQWVQSAFLQVDKSASTTTTNAKTTAAGVQNALTWFDAGQSIAVRPRWTGGKSAVVELEVQKAGFDERTGADLPTQNRNTVSTTVTAPLAQWVTIAATGRTPQTASYSSESAQQARRLLQIRVMVP